MAVPKDRERERENWLSPLVVVLLRVPSERFGRVHFADLYANLPRRIPAKLKGSSRIATRGRRSEIDAERIAALSELVMDKKSGRKIIPESRLRVTRVGAGWKERVFNRTSENKCTPGLFESERD